MAQNALEISHGYPFDSRAAVSQEGLLDALEQVVIDNSMPPQAYQLVHRGSGLTAREKLEISAWLNTSRHTLDRAQIDGMVADKITSGLDFKINSGALAVLEKRCATCHAPGKSAGYVFGSILDYRSLSIKGFISLNDIEASALTTAMRDGSMPLNEPRLSELEFDLVIQNLREFKKNADREMSTGPVASSGIKADSDLNATLKRTKFGQVFEQIGSKFDYPIENFMTALNHAHDDSNRPGFLITPYSRSAQKNNVGLLDPRVIAGIGQTSTIFVGYAPRAHQIKIITPSDRDTDRSEFLVIENYGPGLVPKIVRPEPSKCLICHQAGGPIFSRRPWGEFLPREVGGDENLFAKLIIKSRSGDSHFYGIDLARYMRGFNFLDVANTTLDGQAANFDSLVRRANFHLQKAGVVRRLCGADIGCRKLILESALLNPRLDLKEQSELYSFDSVSASSINRAGGQFFEALDRSVKSHWPHDQFGRPSSVLPDRSVRADHKVEGFLLKPLRSDGTDFTFVEMSSRDLELHNPIPPTLLTPLTGIISETKMSSYELPFLEPSVKRPFIGKIDLSQATAFVFSYAFEGLGFNPQNSQELVGALSRTSPIELNKILSSSAAESILRNWPPSPQSLTSFIIQYKKKRSN